MRKNKNMDIIERENVAFIKMNLEVRKKDFEMRIPNEVIDAYALLNSIDYVKPSEILICYSINEDSDDYIVNGLVSSKVEYNILYQTLGVESCYILKYLEYEDNVCGCGENESNIEYVDIEDIVDDIEKRMTAQLPVCLQAKKWIKSVPFRKFYEEIAKTVIGQKNLAELCIRFYHYIDGVSQGLDCKERIILSGPSGCGKTETYRAIKRYFEKHIPLLPISISDATTITETGYRGANPDIIVENLFTHCETNGYGIVFIDEIDKKIMPSYSGYGENCNAKVQQCLLMIIEGNKMVNAKTKVSIDTSKTLFVGMGSFDDARVKENNHKISFGDTYEKMDHYKEITLSDMQRLGGINELLGRFTSLIAYNRISDEATIKIINNYIEGLMKEFNIDIEMADNVIKMLLQRANSEYGCRILFSIMRERIYTLRIKNELEGIDCDCTYILDEDGDTLKYEADQYCG